MNRDELDRLKEAEKAHLKKVRALKAQLHEAQRHQSLTDALNKLDTSDLDAEFDRALRDVQQKNVTAEARLDLALDAIDDAAERERKRLEMERFEADQQRSAAADLVKQMKADLQGSTDPVRGTSSQASPPETPTEREASPESSQKTIGRPRPRTE